MNPNPTLHRWISRAICAAILSLTITLAIAYSADPPTAGAHVVTPKQCAKIALAQAQEVPPATRNEWRIFFRRCMADAKQHALHHACSNPRAPLPFIGRVRGKAGYVGMQQRRNVTVALNTARKMRAPRSHQVAVLAAALQEQGWSNKPYGHGSSVGFLQLIDAHGSTEWRMRVRNSSGWFLRGARQLDPHGTVPLATTDNGWGLMQRVQRSGHPSLYNQWIDEARAAVVTFYRPCKR